MDNRHINTREFKSDTSRQAEMASLIRQLAPHEGHTKSLLDGVRLMRADHPLGRTPVLYEPSIVIVCQGHKRGYLANQVYHYDAQHYLVLSVPLPFSTETEASPEEPFAGCLRSSRHDRRGRSDHRGRSTGHQSGKPARRHRFHAIDATLADTTVRLLRALCSPLEARVLGPAIVRELCFRVLVGGQGGAIRAALAKPWQFRTHRACSAAHS